VRCVLAGKLVDLGGALDEDALCRLIPSIRATFDFKYSKFLPSMT